MGKQQIYRVNLQIKMLFVSFILSCGTSFVIQRKEGGSRKYFLVLYVFDSWCVTEKNQEVSEKNVPV